MTETESLATVYNKKFADTVTRNFKEFLDTDLYVDLIFVCRNNVKVGAHQVVMSLISKFFYEMVIENGKTVKDKVIHVYVPDIRPRIMKHILEFVYCGKTKVHKTEWSEFNEDVRLLGMPLDTSPCVTSSANSNSANVVNPSNTTLSTPVPKAMNSSNTTICAPVPNVMNSSNTTMCAPVPKVMNSSSTTTSAPVPNVMNSSNTMMAAPVPKMMNSSNRTTSAPQNNITTAIPVLPVVAASVPSNEPPESLTNCQSESVVSSSNTSVPISSDLSASSTTSNLATPILPVILTSQSLNKSHMPKKEHPRLLSQSDMNVENKDCPGSSVPNQSNINMDNRGNRRKRRKLNEMQASHFISLDSDDEKDNDVITLS